MGVVYFSQCLGAGHSRHWSKYVFTFFHLKIIKRKKKQTNWGKINKKCVFEFDNKIYFRILFPEKCVFFSTNIWVQTKNNIFFVQFCLSFLAFSSFLQFLGKKWKSTFWPAFGVHTAQQVKTCNRWDHAKLSIVNKKEFPRGILPCCNFDRRIFFFFFFCCWLAAWR